MIELGNFSLLIVFELVVAGASHAAEEHIGIDGVQAILHDLDLLAEVGILVDVTARFFLQNHRCGWLDFRNQLLHLVFLDLLANVSWEDKLHLRRIHLLFPFFSVLLSWEAFRLSHS